MNAEDLRNLLENSNDRFNIFKDKDIFSKYNLNIAELKELIEKFLVDEQKVKLFELEHFKGLNTFVRYSILQTILDDKIMMEVLTKSDITSDFEGYKIMTIIDSLGSDNKEKILHMKDFLQEHDIKDYEIRNIIKSLNEKSKKDILLDKNFIIEELKLEEYQVLDLITSLEDEESKLEMIPFYELKEYQIAQVVKTLSDTSKTEILLNNKYEFGRQFKTEIISTMSVDLIVKFINENKEFMKESKISPYQVTKILDKEKQIEFISKLEDTDLSIEEKRKILATISEETKENIDTTNFSQEYITAIEMQIGNKSSEINSMGKVIIDFSKDLEIYRGLDEIIYLNPMELIDIDKSKILELCGICPEIKIHDNIGLCPSTTEEYKNGELWVESVLQGIDSKWSDIQKVAFIDHAIGKKISYSPDFDTEISDEGNARALWKIIDSGYGVCNGIAQVEQYVLSKVGIEAEKVSAPKHAFLKLKNIEIPNKEGGTTKGDTILDPTWNLTAHRYGGRPQNFCRSYDEIRKHDIRNDGTDAECHKNDEKLASATLELDEQSLRKIFTSIGLTDKDGNFPIKALIDKSKAIDDCNLPTEESIKKQLALLAEYCPEFATCQNSTIDAISQIVLNQENLTLDKCVVNRVYAKEDGDKRPVLYVYVDSQEFGKKFYIPDTKTKQFAEIASEEFISRFECYEMDMKKQNGYRPWETVEEAQKVEDLTRSSGNVVASKGDDR